ncbi:hypothetical protein ACGFZP_30390 [Kitasatospora sp. NPDC048239]|uniref:hypothetical protein n=1 Tax=Kitasatospora sp. NPDC048239 TaxID=3364046 RepID=UPI003723963E
MPELPDIQRALESYVDGGPRPDPEGMRRMTGAQLLQSGEHAVARTLLLAALCARLDGGASDAAGLVAVARSYEEGSFLYTGRIIPRFTEMIVLLDRAVDERCPRTLVELADHLSQGWPAFPSSVFPAALARLAAELGFTDGAEPFATTSFTRWRRGLETAADGRADLAAPLFDDSLARYRAYLYHADAAWLFTDLVIVHLMQGHEADAAGVFQEQGRYVEEVLADYPVTGDGPPVFQLGDVQSGDYSTFVESVTLQPTALTEADRAILRRYARVSELLLSAARYRSQRDFEAALDLFSFGWTSFPDSPYPHIFQHLADRLAGAPGRWGAQLTGYARWHRMLRSGRVRPTSPTLIDTAVDLHDRLTRAGLTKQADIALLDAAIIHAELHGTTATVEWISRYTRELRPEIPELLRTAVTYLQLNGETPDTSSEGAQRLLAHYAGLRELHTVPALVAERAARRRENSVQVEVALYGRLLSIEGITVYEQTPEPLVDILQVLGEEFAGSVAEGREVPLLSAAELSSRTGRTTAALAQSVRRFRGAAQERFGAATEFTLDPDTVIQGRPGYRINPVSVESFHRFPPDR